MVNKTDLNEILETQRKAYYDVTSIMVENMNKRLDDQNKLIFELRHSLEFSQKELADVSNELKLCREELSICKTKTINIDDCFKELNDCINHQEDYSRRGNIRIEGLLEQNGETDEQIHKKVQDIIERKLNLTNVKIQTAHRIRKQQKLLLLFLNAKVIEKIL